MKPTCLLVPGLAVGALLALPARGHGQTSPFLPDARYRDLVNEISGDRAYENVRWLTHYHRTGGSADFFRATEWIRKAAVEAGLEDVKLVRQAYREKSWSCQRAEAWLVSPDERKLADYHEVAVSIADNSRSAAVEAELVDAGAGDSAADYQGREVKGKVVLGSASAGALHREAVLKRGALGVISYATNRPEVVDAPDQVAWQAIDAEAKGIDGVKDGTPGTFGFSISPRRGRALSREMKGADKTFKVKIQVEASAPEKGEQAMVEGWIKGTEIADQQIVLTAHIQEEMTSANDDGSGCGNLLEIGRALTRLIKEGKLPRPKRDLRFWWVNEFSSEEQFFRENPKEPRRMLLNLNQDMVGARQSWGGRVQYASRLPWSLPHALDDVMESVLTMVSEGNTSFLTTRGTKLPVPFTREITAVKGSREPFNARMVPYFDSTDHHAFNPAPVSVPGTSLTNWPDEFIHSTGDDLENIDATQLERNAVVVAAVATYFANVSDEDAPALAAYVATRARARILADVATGVAHIAESAPADRDRAFRAARSLVRHSTLKEMEALSSLRRLAPRGRAADYARETTARLEDAMGADLQTVEKAYEAIVGRNPPNLELNKDEKAMAAKVFVPTTDIAKVQDSRDALRSAGAGLHGMMRFEVLNFADGKRNAYEIYEAVASEALSAGTWYYGEVQPADVMTLLDKAADAGVLTARTAR
ncbi:MAG TPA: M28 family peptidase [Vicinamibacteria bacterium]|nr:M28 family peptidase [Vicinamibacteria bacterium]